MKRSNFTCFSLFVFVLGCLNLPQSAVSQRLGEGNYIVTGVKERREHKRVWTITTFNAHPEGDEKGRIELSCHLPEFLPESEAIKLGKVYVRACDFKLCHCCDCLPPRYADSIRDKKNYIVDRLKRHGKDAAGTPVTVFEVFLSGSQGPTQELACDMALEWPDEKALRSKKIGVYAPRWLDSWRCGPHAARFE